MILENMSHAWLWTEQAWAFVERYLCRGKGRALLKLILSEEDMDIRFMDELVQKAKELSATQRNLSETVLQQLRLMDRGLCSENPKVIDYKKSLENLMLWLLTGVTPDKDTQIAFLERWYGKDFEIVAGAAKDSGRSISEENVSENLGQNTGPDEGE